MADRASFVKRITLKPDFKKISSDLLELPVASYDNIGCVKVGDGLSITDSKISLSPASSYTLGGVKIGNGITSDAGTISIIVPVPVWTTADAGKTLKVKADGSGLEWA